MTQLGGTTCKTLSPYNYPYSTTHATNVILHHMIQEVRADMRKHIGEWRMTQLDGATRKTPFTPCASAPHQAMHL